MIFIIAIFSFQFANAQGHRGSSSDPIVRINYKKYINKKVTEFLSDFKRSVIDTIAIRDYVGITGFILKLKKQEFIYVYPKVTNDISNQNRKLNDPFDIKFFYPYKIRCIIIRKNGRTLRIYGRCSSRYRN
jgi:hypothetical protein